MSTHTFSEFPAYSRIFLGNYNHSIVTAGVHPRFGSELRTEVLTPPLNVRTLARHQPLYFALLLRRDLCFW